MGDKGNPVSTKLSLFALEWIAGEKRRLKRLTGKTPSAADIVDELLKKIPKEGFDSTDTPQKTEETAGPSGVIAPIGKKLHDAVDTGGLTKSQISEVKVFVDLLRSSEREEAKLVLPAVKQALQSWKQFNNAKEAGLNHGEDKKAGSA